jgi:hypothetical protein
MPASPRSSRHHISRRHGGSTRADRRDRRGRVAAHRRRATGHRLDRSDDPVPEETVGGTGARARLSSRRAIDHLPSRPRPLPRSAPAPKARDRRDVTTHLAQAIPADGEPPGRAMNDAPSDLSEQSYTRRLSASGHRTRKVGPAHRPVGDGWVLPSGRARRGSTHGPRRADTDEGTGHLSSRPISAWSAG